MYEKIVQASKRLEGVAHKTPIITSRLLDKETGNQIFLKCENFQRAGSFKFRGAYNAVRSLDESVRRKGIITYSSGNHAQAVALAGQLFQVPTTVVVPEDTAKVKIDAARGYGATIVFYKRKTENREEVTQRLIEAFGYTFIPPFNHEEVIAGQGTVAKELIEEVGVLDYLFVPCSGGGLLSGSAVSAKQLSPNCQVIGVQPRLADYAVRSFKTGKLHTVDYSTTIVDALRGTGLGCVCFSIIQEFVDEMITVNDEEVIQSMYFLWTRLKLVVELGGATSLAPLFRPDFPVKGKKIGVILSGGNADVTTVSELFSTIDGDKRI